MDISRLNGGQVGYYRGELLFESEPDWEATAKCVRLINAVGHGDIFHPYHAIMDDGNCWLPFSYRFSSADGNACRRPNALDPGDGRPRTSPIVEARSLLEDAFGCAADLRPLDMGLAQGDDLDLIADLMGGNQRGFWQGEDGAWPQADDLVPEVPASMMHSDARKTGTAVDELEALIGLDGVKRRLREIVSYVSLCGDAGKPCMHMVFRGNPGTCKSTVARIVGRMLGEAGVLSEPDRFIETDRSGLVGQYIGHTAALTKSTIQKARGGVLFIDEAYALGMYAADLGANPDGSGNRHDFGDEAIAELVKEMEDHRDDLVCIMAGYTKPMDHMLRQNPGLRDRVGFYLDFPDYTADELLRIFLKFAGDAGLSVDQEAQETLGRTFPHMVANKPADFSNARIVRKIFERARMKQALMLREADIHADTRTDAHAAFSMTSSAGGVASSGAGGVASSGAVRGTTGSMATDDMVITGKALDRALHDEDLARELGHTNVRQTFGFCAQIVPLPDPEESGDEDPAQTRRCS